MVSTGEQMWGDKNLKRKLIKSVESVKKKVKALRSDKVLLSTALETTFEPITKPLNTLASNATAAATAAAAAIKAEVPSTNPDLKNFVKTKPYNNNIKTERKSYQFESDNKNSGADKNDSNEDNNGYSSDDSNETMRSAVDSYDDDDDDDGSANPATPIPIPPPLPPPPLINDHLKYVYEQKRIPYGVIVKPDGLYIGDSPISFFENQLSVKNSEFPLTRGLMELIFRKEPAESVITTGDIDNYMKILTMTHAYRRGFKETGQVQALSNVKYRSFIKKYLTDNKIIKGGCLSNNNNSDNGVDRMNVKNKREITMKRFYPNTDYIYWDNPNELVDRLRLLIASQSAGNTNHTNEINSIIEELKEAGIIIM